LLSTDAGARWGPIARQRTLEIAAARIYDDADPPIS
jgi:hypothetical protein